jgi:hypothetical protein
MQKDRSKLPWRSQACRPLSWVADLAYTIRGTGSSFYRGEATACRAATLVA